MGRYYTVRVDRAQGLVAWLNQQIEEENKDLGGATLSNRLHFRGQYWESGKFYCNGYSLISIEFGKETPNFNSEEEKTQWYSHILHEAKELFDLGHINGMPAKSELYSVLCTFEEPNEELLYSLTQNKIDILSDCFSTIREYVSWYTNEVEQYSNNFGFLPLETLTK